MEDDMIDKLDSLSTKSTEEDEVLYKMVDGERVPCSAEETAQIKADWALAAVEAQKSQQINDLKQSDLPTADKIYTLLQFANFLAKGEPIPADLATKIDNCCQIQQQIEEIKNS